MNKLKLAGGIVALLFVIVTVLAFDYALPSRQVTHITGVEVKRVDDDGPITKKNPADGVTRDVYYVQTADPDSKEPRVYRNEDSGWYFKFDSADVQAQAQAFARDEAQLVIVKSYGWRSNFFSWFPNVLSVEATDSRDLGFPILNTIIVVGFLAVVGFIALKLRGLFRRRRG